MKSLGLLVEGDKVGGSVFTTVVGTMRGGWTQSTPVVEDTWWFLTWDTGIESPAWFLRWVDAAIG